MPGLTSPVVNTVISGLDISQNPIITGVVSYLLVTIGDNMVPLVPCQPCTIALGAKLGFALVFPIIKKKGQTTTGVVDFTTSVRKASDADFIQEKYTSKLSPEDCEKVQNFQHSSVRYY